MPVSVPPTTNQKVNRKTGRNKIRKKPPKKKAGKPSERITAEGQGLTATTSAPAEAPRDVTAEGGMDEAGVFSTGQSYAPEYHYHVDNTTYPHQVAAQLAEAGAEAAG